MLLLLLLLLLTGTQATHRACCRYHIAGGGRRHPFARLLCSHEQRSPAPSLAVYDSEISAATTTSMIGLAIPDYL